jgi:hypothetical protein
VLGVEDDTVVCDVTTLLSEENPTCTGSKVDKLVRCSKEGSVVGCDCLVIKVNEWVTISASQAGGVAYV